MRLEVGGDCRTLGGAGRDLALRRATFAHEAVRVSEATPQ
jgi:hypothetical protein